MFCLALLALFQQPVVPPVPRPTQLPSRITRVAVEPAEPTLMPGDTLRLKATAYDSAGQPLPEAHISFFPAGNSFEGTVGPDGLVTAGAIGGLPVSVVATLRGSRPATQRVRVTIVPPPAATVAIDPAPSRLLVGQTLDLTATVLARTGDRRYDQVTWLSDRPAIVAVDRDGRLTARGVGRVTISARAGAAVKSLALTVVPNPVASVELRPARAAARTGDVIRLAFVAKDGRGAAVPDVRPEYSLSPGNGIVDPDGAFVADLPGSYRVRASFAGRSSETVITVTPRDVVRPAQVVGRLGLPQGTLTMEFWLHPDGKHGYLSTLVGKVYAVDVSDPAHPFITDSMETDARSVNDVMTTEDGKFGVFTREGSSRRVNGIVVFSAEDPAHPRIVSEFSETVSGGVHSTFIYRGYVYLTDDATGSMRVIDIRNPHRPVQVARWETPRTSAGRMLHDIDVRDGLAYLSYWNDGLVVLDVGNGMKGGSPEDPRLVTQVKYDLEALYRDVAAVGGPGFIRGTHTAWRTDRYVIVGDEVFAARNNPANGPGVLGFGRAYGRLQVVDMSDLTNPRIVAWYEPKDGGTHNVWVAGDTLYLGDYQGGLRVVDISGELRGDLARQGREVAHVFTGTKEGQTPNVSMAWGAIYRDGYIYVPDMNAGLVVVRVEPRSNPTP
ncbi:MAG: Ig-like domain-containing protein [Gemmatimonadota bacterium]